MIVKTFKYFDLNNTGKIDKNEFVKSVDKLGVVNFTEADLFDIFNYYDKNKNGKLDYKEFSRIIYDPARK